jgi:soluble P-type ATPase
MSVQYTSAKAYEKNAGKLNELKWTVYGMICSADRADGVSNHEMAEKLQVPTATLSGLTRPLVKADLVRQLKKRPCKITGHLVIAWIKKDPLPRLEEMRREIHGEDPQGKLL